MNELTVGVRDLKARLSEYLRQVRRGQIIVITDHGSPVGRIIPIENDLHKQINALQAAGLVSWSGHRLQDYAYPVQNQSDQLASSLVVEMRG